MEDLIKEIVNLVEHHVKGHRRSLSQDPYRSDWFALFLRAYEAGYCSQNVQDRLTGDRIRDLYVARKLPGDEDLRAEKWEIISGLLSTWDDWRYALDKTGYR